MNTLILLLLLCQDDPAAYKKAVVAAPRPEPTIQKVNPQIDALTLSASNADQRNRELEDMLAKSNKRINDLEDENRILQKNNDGLNEFAKKTSQASLNEREKSDWQVLMQQPIVLSGFEKLADRPRGPRVQWQIVSAPSCQPCGVFIDYMISAVDKANAADRSNPNPWTIGSDDDNHFQIIKITDDEWRKRGYPLPRAELYADDTFIDYADNTEKSISKLTFESLLIQLNRQAAKLPKDKKYGVRVSTLPIKPQVEKLLQGLEPFLDGGTLTLTYNPRQGVVKDYLTIKQGAVGIKIPARTAITFNMNRGELGATFESPQPMVHIPVRGDTLIKSFKVSPKKLSIQLPWMIDPDIGFTDPQSRAAFGESDKPQDEIDEEIPDNDESDAYYGGPRSGHWPSVRAAFNRLHPYCAACGTPNNGNVHHVKPFHEYPELECDPDNLIRLCRDHHFRIGHDPDGLDGPRTPDWKLSNPNVRRDAADFLAKNKGGR